MMNLSGTIGFSIIFGGVVVLGIVLAYASYRNKNRSRRNAEIGDAAARELRDHPNSYDPQKFRDKLVRNPDGSMPNTGE